MYITVKVLKYTSLLIVPLLLNASLTLNFVDGAEERTVDSLGQSVVFSVQSKSGRQFVQSSGGKARVAAMTSLTGHSSVDSEFELTMAAGFAFDRAAPTYDLTAYAGIQNTKRSGVLRLRPIGGWAPRGDGNGFNSGEILHFTVRGLKSNQRLRLKAFSMGAQNPDRMNFYFNGASAPEHYQDLTLVNPHVEGDNARFDMDTQDIVLSNGERFGWGWATEKAGNRSGIRSIEFEVVEISEEPYTADIPEPSTYSLFLLLFVSQLAVLRRGSGIPR